MIFTEGLKAIRDTLIIAGIAMPLGGLYGVLLGYLVTRKQFAGRRTMEMVSMINYALPGTIVGIAYLIAFNDPPIELAGTALLIIACYVFRYGPTGIRATVALLQQIDKSLEEASQGLGAGSGTTFRRVTLPLIVPAFFAGLGVVFIRSMTAISATIFLVSISWSLITVRILENMTELSLGPAAAFSVLVVVIVFVVIALIGRVLRAFRAPGPGAGHEHARRMTRWPTETIGVHVDGVSKRFAHRVKGEVYAARDVRLDVAPGEFLTLLGPSGCGKTTTLRMIAGFETPDEGRIRFGGQDVTGMPANQRGIGFVFQNYALFPHLPVVGQRRLRARGARACRPPTSRRASRRCCEWWASPATSTSSRASSREASSSAWRSRARS